MSRRRRCLRFRPISALSAISFSHIDAANSRRRQPIDTGCAVISAAAALADSHEAFSDATFLR
jgi:hypothetical protein